MPVSIQEWHLTASIMLREEKEYDKEVKKAWVTCRTEDKRRQLQLTIT